MTALVRPEVGASKLCADADELLAAGDLEGATSLYMSAFTTNASTAMSHMRKLDKLSLEEVNLTLEGWLDGNTPPAKCHNKGIAAVFLSTLSPSNLSATIFKMESLLQSGGHGCEEIFARCTDLLEGKRNPPPDGSSRVLLEITRGLAYFLCKPHSSESVRLYLKAYRDNKLETVTLMQNRQSVHLPKLVKAFKNQITSVHPFLVFDHNLAETKKQNDDLDPEEVSTLIEFLLTLSQHDTDVLELQAAHLFLTRRFSDSAEIYSALLQRADKTPLSQERKARLLTCRAAACLSAGGKAAEDCQDLGEAFDVHPATARVYFQKLFTDHATGIAARNHLRQQAERGLSDFRDKVLTREDFRSSEGAELLDPAITSLRTLCHLEPNGGGRELRVRLADCLLLRGEHREALSICSQLAAAPGQQSYQNTVHVLRGYARLLSDDHRGALEDFQAVIEHSTPHPSSCVRALCGRGLLRMMAGSNYLTALDYMTATRLHPQETALTIRCLVPWNYRGLLVTVLLEQGRAVLEEVALHKSTSNFSDDPQQLLQEDKQQAPKRDNNRSGSSAGVQSLAALLMELQPGGVGPHLLAADALYQLGRLLKKLIMCSDTSCLRSLLAVAQPKDRALLQGHCHSVAKRILDGSREEAALREAVTYLSMSIMASGGEEAESLLERGRCYALLGQRKTAIFDFTAILKKHPKHVQALCGRGFTYLMLDQEKECIHDVLEALQVDADSVVTDILSVKEKARKLVCDWLHKFCRTNLSDTVRIHSVPCHEEHLKEAFIVAGALMRTDSRDPRWHLLYVDILLAKGDIKAAGTHLCHIFGQEPRDAVARARVGVMEAWQQNYHRAALRFSNLLKKDSSSLDFLLALIPFNQQRCLAKAAAQEASSLSSEARWDQAVPLLTVAVQAAGNHKLLYLRQRAACLAQLSLHEQAIADLDRIIQKHGGYDGSSSEDRKLWAYDLCNRGSSLLLCSKEEAALEDFIQALELHRDQAMQAIAAGPGRRRLAECFLRGALQHYGEQQLGKVWTMIECGLLLDSQSTELRRLRTKVKREVASPCNVN
ncbi:Tetratricopeptide repeat protein 34 [Oryzias melastigma]|uniref:Tetratricopeptide repeat protein 34 n=1 Tax=Oryzias melastigma TaxID=30732 RepID=A0A834KW62_ORYME|nr:Tetratricopeptide repeat protein 34 [Oryzias melastigma]